MLEKPENRVDPNQLITNAKICWYHMRALACICMHTQHWHYFISIFFLANPFFKFYLFQKQISDIRYTICLNPIKSHCRAWSGSIYHQMTQITSRNHTAWGPIRRVGLLANTAYPMQSVKTRMRWLSSVAFLKSQNNFKILIVI